MVQLKKVESQCKLTGTSEPTQFGLKTSWKRGAILILCDGSGFDTSLVSRLREMGYVSIAATDVFEAIRWLERMSFTLIVGRVAVNSEQIKQLQALLHSLTPSSAIHLIPALNPNVEGARAICSSQSAAVVYPFPEEVAVAVDGAFLRQGFQDLLTK